MHTQEVGTHLNRYLPRAEISIICWTLESWASHTARVPVPKALTWEVLLRHSGTGCFDTSPFVGWKGWVWLPFFWFQLRTLLTESLSWCTCQQSQQKHVQFKKALLLIMLVVTTPPEAANRGEMCGHSPSCRWECSQLPPTAALYSLFQEV